MNMQENYAASTVEQSDVKVRWHTFLILSGSTNNNNYEHKEIAYGR